MKKGMRVLAFVMAFVITFTTFVSDSFVLSASAEGNSEVQVATEVTEGNDTDLVVGETTDVDVTTGETVTGETVTDETATNETITTDAASEEVAEEDIIADQAPSEGTTEDLSPAEATTGAEDSVVTETIANSITINYVVNEGGTVSIAKEEVTILTVVASVVAAVIDAVTPGDTTSMDEAVQEDNTNAAQQNASAQGATASAAPGYEFVNWTCNGEVVSTDVTFVPDSLTDATYVANFKLYDAIDFGTTTVGGVDVSIAAPAGAFQAGTTVSVTPVAASDVVEKVDEATEGVTTEDDLIAFDITFQNAAGEEVQPVVPIAVSFTKVDLAGDTLEVFHMEDANSVAEPVAEAANTGSIEVANADSFSLYVLAASKSYTLTFNLNDATAGPAPAAITVSKTGTSITLPTTTATRTNYVFLGWSTVRDINLVTTIGNVPQSIPIYAAGETYEVSASTTLYAAWAQVSGANSDLLTVAVRADGIAPAEPSVQDQKYYFIVQREKLPILTYVHPLHTVAGVDAVSAMLTSDFQSFITTRINNYIKGTGANNIEFSKKYNSTNQYIRWYVVKEQKDEEGTNEWHIDGVICDKAKYTLTYDANCTSYTGKYPDSLSYTANAVTSVDPKNQNTLARSGYTFLGWNTDKTATTATYQAGTSITMNSNITLYAVWKANNTTAFTVNHYITISGTSTDTLNSTESKTGLTDSTINSVDYVKTIPGYKYDSSRARSTTISADGKAVLNIYYVKDAAQWFTLSYDGNTATSEPGGRISPVDYINGTTVTLVSVADIIKNKNYVKTGYVFDGWTLEEGQNNTTSANKVTTVTLNSNKTVHATWKAIPKIQLAATPVTVSYDGGAHGISVVATADGKTITPTLQYATSENGSWSTNPITFTNVGTQTVYVKATADGYIDSDVASALVTINKKQVTITIASKTKIYDGNTGTDPLLTGTIDGLVKSSDLGTVTYSRTIGQEVGQYPITANYNSNTNYTVSVIGNNFVITKASGNQLTVTVPNAEYDKNQHGLAVTASKAGSTIKYSVDQLTWSTTPITYMNAGIYTIYVKAENPNYVDTAIQTATLVIKPKAVKILVTNQDKTYGTVDPTFTGEITGLIGGDTLKNLQYLRTDATKGLTDAGAVVKITAKWTADTNYAVTVQEGTLTIKKASDNGAQVTGTQAIYDGKQHVLIAAKPLREGSTVLFSTVAGTKTDTDWSTQTPAFTEAGTYTVYIKVTNKNYDDAYTSGSVVITPAEVTITALDATKKYGEKDPAFEGTVTGVYSTSKLTVTYARAAADIDKKNVGDIITIVPSYVINSNYNVTSKVNAKLTITTGDTNNKVTADNVDVTYDGSAHGLANVKLDDTQDGSTIMYSVDGIKWDITPITFTNVGTYKVYVKAINPNKIDTDVITKNINISKAKVAINVADAEKYFNDADPTFAGTITGTVYGNDLGTITYGRLSSDVGKQNVGEAITLTAFYTQNNNYDVTISPAKLTIKKALSGNTLTIEGTTATYDGTAHGLTKATASVADSKIFYSTTGDGNWSETAPTLTNAGELTIYVKAENANYETIYAQPVKITVNKKVATITVNSTSKTYGGTEPTITGKVDGLVKEGDLGTVSYFRATSDENKGNVGDIITLTASYTNNTNYDVKIIEGTLTINKATGNVVSITAPSATYDGVAHGITSIKAIDGSNFLYSENGTDWRSAPYTYTEAGTHIFYAKATNPNYVDSESVKVEIVINKANVKITVDNKSKFYGANDPAFTGEIQGLVAEGALGTVQYSRTKETKDLNNAGDVIAITASYTENPNYAVTVIKGTLTIEKTTGNSVSVTGTTATYNGQAQALTAANPLQAGSTVWFKTNRPGAVWTTKVPSYTNAGSYTVYVKATNPNYKDTEVVTGNIVINKATVTIAAEDATKVYGNWDPKFTGTVTGLVDKDDLAIIYTRKIKDLFKENVGDDITIVATYIPNNNYNVVENKSAKLTITKAETNNSVNAKSVEVTYDGTAHGLSKVSLANKFDGSTIVYSADNVNWSQTPVTYTDKGEYTVFVKATNPNKLDTKVIERKIVIKAAQASIIVTPATKEFGTTDPNFIGTVKGLVKSNDLGIITYSRITGDKDKNAVGDSITIDAFYAANSNYTVTVETAQLTINKATAGNEISNIVGTKAVYDGKAHGLTQVTAKQEGSRILYSTDQKEWSATAPTLTNAGELVVYVKAEHDSYVDTQVVTAVISVSQRPIIITASSANMTAGDQNTLSNNTYSVSTTIAGESPVVEGDVLTAYVTGGQSEVGSSSNHVSDYVIKHGDTIVTGNYSITTVDGTLRVDARPQVTTPTTVAEIPVVTPTTILPEATPLTAVPTTTRTRTATVTTVTPVEPTVVTPIEDEAVAAADKAPATTDEKPAVTTIQEESTPLATLESDCWIHWLILLLTLLYSVYSVARAVVRHKKIKELQANEEAVNGTV